MIKAQSSSSQDQNPGSVGTTGKGAVLDGSSLVPAVGGGAGP